MKTAKITETGTFEGPSYEINTEDGPGSTFNHLVYAITEDGQHFCHVDSFEQNEKWRAEKLAQEVRKRGWINLYWWREMPPEISFEDRMALEAERDQLERAGFDVTFWG